MQTQEKKLIAEIKQMAGKGQNDACKIMAKQLVRNRRAIQKFYQLKVGHRVWRNHSSPPEMAGIGTS